jgi:ABC-type bacteriocin/lantibiotic exporter with double-glycine peptidase domain
MHPLARFPDKLLRYIRQATGWHQVLLLTLTVAVFLIEVVPLELQRRIVNDAVKHREFNLIVLLCAVYAGVALVHGLLKLVLNVYRGWVAQHVTRDLRKRVRELEIGKEPNSMAEERGLEISMIIAEAEPIGLFVAGALSEPLLQGGILATVLAYMVHIDVWMTLIAAAIFVPQFVFVPVMQGAINRRTKAGISILRILSASLTDPQGATDNSLREDEARIDKVFGLNMGVFKLKYGLNFLMNYGTHLQIVAALLYGGYLVLNSRLEIGGVVAFISGVSRLTDPWGDLVNYFRDLSLAHVKYRLLANTTNQIAERHEANGGQPQVSPLRHPRERGDPGRPDSLVALDSRSRGNDEKM